MELNRIPSQIVAGSRIRLVKAYPVALLAIDRKRGVLIGVVKWTRSTASGIQFHVPRHKGVQIADGPPQLLNLITPPLEHHGSDAA